MSFLFPGKDTKQNPMKFDQTYHLNANALYIALRRQHKDNESVDFGALFLNTTVQGNEYDTLLVNDTEKRVATEMTRRQKEMFFLLHTSWNEGNTVDFETAMEALIESIDTLEGGLAKEYGEVEGYVNWCDYCGKPFLAGYKVGQSKEACSDTCMEHIMSELHNVPINQASALFDKLSCEENNQWYFTSEYV